MADRVEYFLTYEKWVSSVPYVSEYFGVLKLMAENMFQTAPGRAAMALANTIASAEQIPQVFKMEKVKADVQAHHDKGWTLPEILNLHRDKYLSESESS